jgi:endoglucanase
MAIRAIKGLLFVTLVVLFSSKAPAANDKLAFWDVQRKGANGDAMNPEAWFKAAADVGIEFVRLAPVTWESEGRDFLLGDADNFTSIPDRDYAKLKSALDIAHRHNVKIILTMFSLPGARNRQFNDYKFDYRLWTDEKYQEQALAFWTQLAARLKDHPAIVAYNPLNEPYPARKDGFEDGDEKGFGKWLIKHKDTTADLNRFNRRIVKAIRSVDTQTPIILNGWFHSAPIGLRYLEPMDDKAVLYAFHFYDPWVFATYRINKGRFEYPDKMPAGADATKAWTQADLKRCFQPVLDWAKRFDVPASRIVAEEFGCDRRVVGARDYLEDLIATFNKHQWHWAFYSFRSSGWDGLDYELGTEKLGWKYWQEREKGIAHEALIQRYDNPLWNVFKREFSPKTTLAPSLDSITNPKVRELIEALGSEEWRQREEAADDIWRMDIEAKAAIPFLIERLQDEEWRVRKAAAYALSRMGPEATPAVLSLTRALTDEEWQVRRPAAEALTAIGPASEPAVSTLTIALDDEEWQVCKAAAQALAAIGSASKPAVPELSKALNHEEWHVRRPAAEALAAIGPASKPAIPTLIELLADEEWQVRKAAAQALGAVGPEAISAIPALKEALDDAEDQVRDAAAEALKKINPQAGP